MTQTQDHVNFLSNRVNAKGGTPASICVYNFNTVTNVSTYITVAQRIEQISTNAYVGVISGFTDPDLHKAAAQLGEIEARHSAYLAHILTRTSTGTFPEQFSRVVGINETLTNLMQFIVSCPYTIKRPLDVLPDAFIFNGTVPTPSSVIVNYSRPMYDNDMRILQLLLNVEQLVVALYNLIDTYLSVSTYVDIRSYFEIIRQHEIAHVAFLRRTIENRQGTPVSSCSYTFTNNITNATNFFAYARFRENIETGVYAYIANAVTDPELLTPLSTVFTVDAKHASYLNEITKEIHFLIASIQ